MWQPQVGEKPFSEAETARIVWKFHDLEKQYGVGHVRVRLQAANRALRTLINRGFATNLPNTLDI